MKTDAKSILIVMSVLTLFISWTAVAQEPADLEALRVEFINAVDAHDFDLAASYFAEDGVFNFVAFPAPMRGRQEIRAFFENLLASFSDFYTTEARVLATGNIVVEEHSLVGTHDGEWVGIPATGNAVEMPHLDIYEFESGKIKRLTSYLDLLEPLVQVGAMPAPEMPALVPTYALPEPEATGQSPWDADVQLNSRWNTHDLPQYARLHRADAPIFVGPLGRTVGRDEWVALTEQIFRGFSGQSHVVRRIDFGDGRILTEYQNRAVHNGPYMGLPASGNWTNLG